MKSNTDNTSKKITKEQFKKFLGIYSFLLPYKWELTISILLLFFSTASFMVFPELIKNLLDSTKKGQNEIDKYALWLFGILVFMAVTSYFRVVLNTKLSERTTGDIRRSIYAKLITMPIEYFEKNRVGDLSSRINNDVTQLNEMLSWSLSEMLRQVIILVGGIIIILYSSAKLGGIMISTLPVTILVAFYIGRKIKKLSKKTQDALATSNVIVEETFQGIQTVKTFTNERFEINRYAKAIEETVQFAVNASLYRGGLISFVIVGMFGGIILVLWYGMTMVSRGELTFGEFTSFLFLTGIIGGAIGSLGDLYGRFQRTLGATERLDEILKDAGEINVEKNLKHTTFLGNIEFKNVQFSYPTRPDVEVLKGVSFSIDKGQKIALVGSSGSGKSTISRLLLGFYNIENIDIFFDGKKASNFSLPEIRENIGLVPQEVLLFGGSIRENIAYAKPNATEAEIIDAAKKAYAWDFISEFPDGLNTIVGERGVQLSGGQKQRVAIARVILKNPSILVLDEATSALDTQSEYIVQKALDELMQNLTTLIIAHRLSTIKNADKILVLKDGKIEENGNHESLSKIENGLYATLLKGQFVLS